MMDGMDLSGRSKSRSPVSYTTDNRIEYSVKMKVYQTLRCNCYLYRFAVLFNCSIISRFDLNNSSSVSSAGALLCMCNPSAKTLKLNILTPKALTIAVFSVI